MKLNFTSVLYVISSIFIVNYRLMGVDIPYYIQSIIMALWTLYLLGNWLVGTNKQKKRFISIHIILITLPVVLCAGYAFIIWAFNPSVIFRNYTRLTNTCLQLFLAWGFGASGYYLFKDKVVDYVFVGGVISYLFGSVLFTTIRFGVSGMAVYILNLITGKVNPTSIEFLMEVHDLTFAMGCFFLFYAFFDNRKKRKGKILLSLLLIFLGLKRIEVLALALAAIVYFLLLKWGKTIHYRALFLATCFSIITFGFVYLIDSGLLELICSALSLDTSGRLGMYSYAKNYFEFSPLYFGKGYTYFSRMWGELYKSGFRVGGHAIAGAVHSSALTFFIENGFFMTLLWIFYSFNIKVKKMKKLFGNKVAECYLLLTVYMFILYLTDNVINYTGTQLAYFIIPLCQKYIVERNHIEGSPKGVNKI